MEEAFLAFLRLLCPDYRDKRFLLAVSGGVDSVVMARLFQKSGLRFGLAHLNYGLRTAESDGDEALVRKMAEEMDVPLFAVQMDAASIARESNLSIQEAARALRLDYLHHIKTKEGFDLVALAHHQDDALETFFINLLRGTGIKGLGGIPAQRDELIRPMMFTGRVEIEAYARKEGLTWREDSSNATDTYLRNRIRHHLLPLLAEIRPGARQRLLKNMDRLAGESLLLETFLQRPPDESEASFDFTVPVGIPADAIPVFIHSVIATTGFSFETARQVAEALNKSESRQFFSLSHQIVLSQGRITVRPKSEKKADSYAIPHWQDLPPLPVYLEMEVVDREALTELDEGPQTALVDFDRLEWPLTLRRRKDGDVFHPLGMQGTKKVKDFLIDQKIPFIEREDLWLLCSGTRIVWLAGYRLDHRFRVNAETRQVLRIRLGEGEA
jgi:tRNA(Ile)-lysidine synthase